MTTTAQPVGDLTLLDQMLRMNPDGTEAKIVELMTQRNPLLEDSVVLEANTTTGHVVTSRLALPAPTWRKYNQGVATAKSKTGQFTESCGMMAGLSKVDVDLAELGGNPGAKRAQEDNAFVQSMSNEFETGTFYHSTTTAPEKFMGLTPRFNGLTSSSCPHGYKQVVAMDGSASGSDQASAWLIGWGPETVYHIYPRGTMGGLQSKDLGERLVQDANGDEYTAWVTKWKWNVGLVVQDPRYVVRVANIDMGNIAATGNALVIAMVKADHRIYRKDAARLAWYVNRSVATYLHLQALDTHAANPAVIRDVGGKPVLTFLGVPVRTTDALLNTEDTLA